MSTFIRNRKLGSAYINGKSMASLFVNGKKIFSKGSSPTPLPSDIDTTKNYYLKMEIINQDTNNATNFYITDLTDYEKYKTENKITCKAMDGSKHEILAPDHSYDTSNENVIYETDGISGIMNIYTGTKIPNGEFKFGVGQNFVLDPVSNITKILPNSFNFASDTLDYGLRYRKVSGLSNIKEIGANSFNCITLASGDGNIELKNCNISSGCFDSCKLPNLSLIQDSIIANYCFKGDYVDSQGNNITTDFSANFVSRRNKIRNSFAYCRFIGELDCQTNDIIHSFMNCVMEGRTQISGCYVTEYVTEEGYSQLYPNDTAFGGCTFGGIVNVFGNSSIGNQNILEGCIFNGTLNIYGENNRDTNLSIYDWNPYNYSLPNLVIGSTFNNDVNLYNGSTNINCLKKCFITGSHNIYVNNDFIINPTLYTSISSGQDIVLNEFLTELNKGTTGWTGNIILKENNGHARSNIGCSAFGKSLSTIPDIDGVYGGTNIKIEGGFNFDNYDIAKTSINFGNTIMNIECNDSEFTGNTMSFSGTGRNSDNYEYKINITGSAAEHFKSVFPSWNSGDYYRAYVE